MSDAFKVVKGAKYQKRPSASYFYKKLMVPIGYTVEYRPRKGGKLIKHSLQLKNNGTPYWKAEEKLPKTKTKKTKKTKRTKRTKKTKKTKRTNRTKRTKITKKTKKTKRTKRTKRKSSKLRGGQ